MTAPPSVIVAPLTAEAAFQERITALEVVVEALQMALDSMTRRLNRSIEAARPYEPRRLPVAMR